MVERPSCLHLVVLRAQGLGRDLDYRPLYCPRDAPAGSVLARGVGSWGGWVGGGVQPLRVSSICDGAQSLAVNGRP
eukprot:8382179-Pyramimonas_sp.AAC.1